MKDPRFAKLVVFVNALVPLALLGWDAYWDHHGYEPKRLSANPIEFAIRTTGLLTLIFLILSLAVTPIRLITGRNWLSHFRRMLGVYAFFYCCVHLGLYFTFDRGLSLPRLVSDTIQRPFILFGMLGFLMMLPLALTSTNGMIKRMGSVSWKRLHKLAYTAGIAGAIHYYLFAKADLRQPIAFATVLALLLGYRMLLQAFPSLKHKKDAAPARRGFPVLVQPNQDD